MKNVIKFLCLAVVISLLLAACGQADEEVFDEEFGGIADVKDLEGVTVKYYRRASGSDQVLGYEYDTVLGDLALERIRKVQNDYNCILDIQYLAAGDPYGTFNLNNSIGSYFCDIFCGVSDMLRQAMKTGALVGLSTVEDIIDFRNEERWGGRNMLEPLYWEDEAYGLIPLSWPTASVSYQGLMIVNEDLIAAVNAEDPRDLFENKQWTWATFRNCLEKYYVQEGADVKQYALTHQYLGNLGRDYIMSNGYILAQKGPDGDYHSGLTDPRVITAMNEATDLAFGPLSYTISIDVNLLDVMVNGQTVLGVLHDSEHISRIVKEMPNFGVLAAPSGPDVEPGYIATTSMNIGNVTVLSNYSPNIEASAIVLNALYEPFEEYPDIDSVKDFLYHTYFFDRRDADIYYDLYMHTQFSYFASSLWNTLHEWLEGGWGPTEYIDAHLDQVEDYIQKEVAPSKRGVDAVWGNE